MKQQPLYGATRSCIVCLCQAKSGGNRYTKFDEKQPVVLALNVTIYRRTKSGRQLATCKRVRVCETCLIKAGASETLTADGRTLGLALIQAATDRYSAMVEAKKK